ncbi:MAG: hypothetical protein ACQEV7_07355 [Bacillota bacterium]
MNEKGSSLLVVLITVSIFMILGVSILTVALGGALRTQIQLDRYENIYEGKEQLDFVISRFKEEVINIPLNTEDLPHEYQNRLDQALNSLAAYENFNAEDMTETYVADKSELFTRVYEFSIVAGEGNAKKTIKKQVILSPAPSFLDYALGSFGEGDDEGLLLVNGSPNVDGDVIANNLHIKNEAEFIDQDGENTASTPFPAISGNINIQKMLSLWDTKTLQPIKFTAEHLQTDQILSSFFYNFIKPDIYSRSEDFVDVNFDQTYLDKLNELLVLPSSSVTSDELLDDNSLNEIRNKIAQQLPESNLPPDLIENDILLDAGTINSIPGRIVYHDSVQVYSAIEQININKPMVINGDLTLTSGLNNPISITQPLTVIGDLTINITDTPIDISGTVIVFGDLIINGNEEAVGSGAENDTIKFDSTIYTWGSSYISNTNIEGIDQEKQLVLFSKGELTITRINEFRRFSMEQDNQNIYDLGNETIPLKAFFYTENNATLYGVGSMFHINGGLFAKKTLEINAIRGNINRSNTLTPLSDQFQLNKKTRFQIVHDPNVLVSQVSRLPVADRLRVIVSETSIK